MADVTVALLGAAGVAEYALIEPAAHPNGIVVAGLGSRDPEKARPYAERHGIARVATYDELLSDPDIEAVFVALPNGLHAEWSIRALEAGKAVLCEKPLSSNADEARAMFAAADRVNGLLVEAMHWRWHPVAAHIREIVASGRLGAIKSVATRFLIPGVAGADKGFRSSYELAGGVTMDAGVYCLDFLRHVLGEPDGVDFADAVLGAPQIDVAMKAGLSFGGGAKGTFHASHVHDGDYVIDARIVGERGILVIDKVFVPQWGHRITLEVDGKGREYQLDMTPTFHFQARGFAKLVRGGGVNLAPRENSMANMAAVDSVYTAAGLRRRGVTTG